MKVLVYMVGLAPGTHGGVENFVYSLIRGFNRACPEIELFLQISPRMTGAFKAVLDGANVTYLEDEWLAKMESRFNRSETLRFVWRVFQGSGIGSRMLGIHGRRWNHRCQTLVDVVLTSTLELPLIHRHKPVVMPIHDLRWFERPETGPQLQSLLQSEPVAAVVAAWPDPFAILCRMAPERTESFFMVPFIMDPPPADHELGNPAIARTLLYTSSNGREKNHEALIRALGMLKRRGVARIRVFCTGPLVSARTAVLQRLIVEEGVQDWILFLGWVPRGFVHWLYEHVAGVITTSTYEAMSGTVMEGWQHGKPVACSRIPSIQAMTDLLGVEVRFFDQNDPEDVARGIEDLLADPDRYGRASLRARACLSRVTQERTALQYRDILAWACGKASKPSWHPYQRWWDGGS